MGLQTKLKTLHCGVYTYIYVGGCFLVFGVVIEKMHISLTNDKHVMLSLANDTYDLGQGNVRIIGNFTAVHEPDVFPFCVCHLLLMSSVAPVT